MERQGDRERPGDLPALEVEAVDHDEGHPQGEQVEGDRRGAGTAHPDTGESQGDGRDEKRREEHVVRADVGCAERVTREPQAEERAENAGGAEEGEHVVADETAWSCGGAHHPGLEGQEAEARQGEEDGIHRHEVHRVVGPQGRPREPEEGDDEMDEDARRVEVGLPALADRVAHESDGQEEERQQVRGRLADDPEDRPGRHVAGRVGESPGRGDQGEPAGREEVEEEETSQEGGETVDVDRGALLRREEASGEPRSPPESQRREDVEERQRPVEGVVGPALPGPRGAREKAGGRRHEVEEHQLAPAEALPEARDERPEEDSPEEPVTAVPQGGREIRDPVAEALTEHEVQGPQTDESQKRQADPPEDDVVRADHLALEEAPLRGREIAPRRAASRERRDVEEPHGDADRLERQRVHDPRIARRPEPLRVRDESDGERCRREGRREVRGGEPRRAPHDEGQREPDDGEPEAAHRAERRFRRGLACREDDEEVDRRHARGDGRRFRERRDEARRALGVRAPRPAPAPRPACRDRGQGRVHEERQEHGVSNPRWLTQPEGEELNERQEQQNETDSHQAVSQRHPGADEPGRAAGDGEVSEVDPGHPERIAVTPETVVARQSEAQHRRRQPEGEVDPAVLGPAAPPEDEPRAGEDQRQGHQPRAHVLAQKGADESVGVEPIRDVAQEEEEAE